MKPLQSKDFSGPGGPGPVGVAPKQRIDPSGPGGPQWIPVPAENPPTSQCNICTHAPRPLLRSGDLHAHARALERHFPRAVPEPVFIDHMAHVLGMHGFTPQTSINLVSTCRDEICKPFTDYLDAKCAVPSFNISSLAGTVSCGRTGFKAAMAHSPIADGKERYVFWVAPHMALSEDNEEGKCFRVGRPSASSACGALLAVLGELKKGRVNVMIDTNDVEMSMLKQQLMGHLQGRVPTLTELTYATHDCILESVKRTAASAVDMGKCEYIIISGIQVHAAFSKTMFWPGSITKYSSRGVENLYEEYSRSVSIWSASDIIDYDESQRVPLHVQARDEPQRVPLHVQAPVQELNHNGLASIATNLKQQHWTTQKKAVMQFFLRMLVTWLPLLPLFIFGRRRRKMLGF